MLTELDNNRSNSNCLITNDFKLLKNQLPTKENGGAGPNQLKLNTYFLTNFTVACKSPAVTCIK